MRFWDKVRGPFVNFMINIPIYEGSDWWKGSIWDRVIAKDLESIQVRARERISGRV